MLLTVGLVNRRRITTFKRTRQYAESDFDLLIRVTEHFVPLYAVAHIAAEVSNLTDLAGSERRLARQVLKGVIERLQEPTMPSIRAVQGRFYERQGLTDAAIGVVAAEKKCGVITDDLDLYLALQSEKIPVLNFAHLREKSWAI